MWIFVNCKPSRHFCNFQKHIDVAIVSANVGWTAFPLCWRLLLAYTNPVVTRQLDQCSCQPSTSPARLLLTPWWQASLVWWQAEGWGLPPIYHIFWKLILVSSVPVSGYRDPVTGDSREKIKEQQRLVACSPLYNISDLANLGASTSSCSSSWSSRCTWGNVLGRGLQTWGASGPKFQTQCPFFGQAG